MPLDGLLEPRVVVSRRQVTQVEAAIVALDRAFWPHDHAGRDRRLPHRMAHVEALETLRGLPEAQFRTERLELFRQPRATRRLHLEPQFRVRAGHCEPACAGATHVGPDPHGTVAAL